MKKVWLEEQHPRDNEGKFTSDGLTKNQKKFKTTGDMFADLGLVAIPDPRKQIQDINKLSIGVIKCIYNADDCNPYNAHLIKKTITAWIEKNQYNKHEIRKKKELAEFALDKLDLPWECQINVKSHLRHEMFWQYDEPEKKAQPIKEQSQLSTFVEGVVACSISLAGAHTMITQAPHMIAGLGGIVMILGALYMAAKIVK